MFGMVIETGPRFNMVPFPTQKVTDSEFLYKSFVINVLQFQFFFFFFFFAKPSMHFIQLWCDDRALSKILCSTIPIPVHDIKIKVLHIEVRLPVLLCAVKTVEGDFRFCWMTTPNVGQTHKENPNLVRILYMVCTLNDIYKQYNKLHEH